MSDAPKQEPSENQVSIKVTDGKAEVFFKIKKHASLSRLMDAFCKRQGHSTDNVRFLFDGVAVKPSDTPESLDMEDNDVIEAHMEQLGGC